MNRWNGARERAGRAVSRLLAGDHEQARARVARPERRERERAGRLRDGERNVVSGRELAQERRQLGGGEQLARNAVDEHGAGSLCMALGRRPSGRRLRRVVLLAPL